MVVATEVISVIADWLRNGDPIKSSGRFVIKHDGLLINNVQESDDGVYTCRAAVIQTGELMERNIQLDVQLKPEITSLGSEYEAIEGQEFSVKCSGKGKPAPEFKWINQDQKNMALMDRFSVVGHNGQMSVTRIEELDRGVYTCIAKNSAGFAEQKMSLNVVSRIQNSNKWNFLKIIFIPNEFPRLLNRRFMK